MWNEPDEEALLRRWFAHMREVQPAIYVTYNGDFFDWPFMETRAAARGLDMHAETGFRMNAKTKECLSRWGHASCTWFVCLMTVMCAGARHRHARTIHEQVNAHQSLDLIITAELRDSIGQQGCKL